MESPRRRDWARWLNGNFTFTYGTAGEALAHVALDGRQVAGISAWAQSEDQIRGKRIRGYTPSRSQIQVYKQVYGSAPTEKRVNFLIVAVGADHCCGL